VASNANAADQLPSRLELDKRPDEVLMKVAQSEMLVGDWGEEGYEPMKITMRAISLDKKCNTTYSIVETTVGVVKSGRAVSIKVKLDQVKCLIDANLGFMRFTFFTDSTYDFVQCDTYQLDGRPRSLGESMYRKPSRGSTR
jgi:hypothetical protein